MSKPPCSLSLDADDLWAYQRTHGDPIWEARGTYLPMFYPIVLDELKAVGAAITFVVVGFDAARPEGGPLLRSVVAAGHEIASHSFKHETWLQRYTPAELDVELAQAEAAIEGACGVRPTGFRGPGFSWSVDLLEILARRGYRWDGSTLPTWIGPVARAYFLRGSTLTPQQLEERSALFGGWRDALRPVKSYQWDLPSGQRLLEIPVTTIPGLKVPFHLSYLIWLASYSPAMMRTYLAAAITACRLTRTEPSILLHPLDVLGGDEVRELSFFPGMQMAGSVKRALFREVLGRLSDAFELMPMGVHAERLHRQTLPRRSAADDVAPVSTGPTAAAAAGSS